jgi:hypothetical protein
MAAFGLSLFSLSIHRALRPSLALAALCVALTAASASAVPQKSQRLGVRPTLTSDQPLYAPGAIAVLTGANFLPNENVILQVGHADGSSALGVDHAPWTVTVNRAGRFVTTWIVCADDCVGEVLVAKADGESSGSSAKTTFGDGSDCDTGMVVSVTPVGGSCSALTPAVGQGPDNFEVQEGGTYTMTIAGVTECSGDTITVFAQNSQTGNFCFNATGGSGTYVGTFTVPSPTCFTMPISYKCGASQPCNNRGTIDAAGPTSCKVHLRTSTFDGNCQKTGDDTDCGASTGACCLEDGSCVASTQAGCLAQGGTYQGEGTACGGVNCPPPPSGACCLADGSCVETTEAGCLAAGGTYQGNATLCANANCPPPPSGACCLRDGSCVEVTEEECATQGGTYSGDSTQCAGIDCSAPSGACCLADGTCVETTEAACDAQGGTYQGDDTLCANANCPPPPSGACCLDASTCVQATQAQCEAQGGFYQGDSSLCENVDCLKSFPCGATFVLDFTTDDTGNPLVHGQKIDTEYDGGPNFPVTIVGSVNPSGQNTASVLNSTTGPATVDPDLLVGKGNILILQTEANLNECPPNSGVYCSHNDDEDGGTLSFAFSTSVRPTSLVLVDIDESDPTSTIVLTDANGKTRTYTVPADWTGDLVEDGPPGYKALLLNTTANQVGFNSTATATEQAGFDQLDVVQIDVHLGGSGAVDDLEWCQ